MPREQPRWGGHLVICPHVLIFYTWGSPRQLGVPGAPGVLGGCSLAGKECVCKIWHGSGQRVRRYEQGKSVTCVTE